MLFLPLVEIKVVREDSASWKLTSLVVVSHHIWPLTQISMTSACATSVSLFTFALFLLDTILTPWRGVIQKSIARMQAHFSLLDVGSAGKIIFLEFAQVSLLAGYRGGIPGIHGAGVPSSSPNHDPISDYKIIIFHTSTQTSPLKSILIFRPGVRRNDVMLTLYMYM